MERRRFLGGAAAAAYGLGAMAPMPALAVPAGVSRRLRFTLTFRNPLERSLDGQSFWCYLPANLAPAQRLHELQVSVVHSVQSDLLGHRILLLSFDRFAPLAQKIVTLTAEVELAPEREFSPLVPKQELSSRDAWLSAERYIESDAPGIRALAAQLRKPTEMASARAIYEWVRDNVHYAGYLADDLGALHALLNRHGDCTEYADLVVALARAAGIPARMVGGYVTDRDVAPRPLDYHNWAQLYLEGAWRTVDSQKENWLSSSAQYIVFRIYRDAATNAVGTAHRYRIDGDLKVAF
jgi:Transglutaminase-like superfamily